MSDLTNAVQGSGVGRPILFSAPMVRALLAGTKTQTRRLAKFVSLKDDGLHLIRNAHGGVFNADDDCVRSMAADFAPIAVGDRLWCREAYSGPYYFTDIAPRHWKPTVPIWYWADGNPDDGDWTKPKPGIHMPRWASRLTLTVTDVRVQRLQDISEEDAIAEGVATFAEGRTVRSISDAEIYRLLWEEINGAGSWEANPWVAAYTFAVEHQNIDAALKAVSP